MHRSAKITALLSTLALLAGCGTSSKLNRIQATKIVPSSEAFLFTPPGGPAIVGVLQTDYSNGTEQQISLATSSGVPGGNYANVKLVIASGVNQASLPNASTAYSDTRSIQKELRAEFPSMRMTPSSLFLQNNYGPFSYAVGQATTGDTCLYGWQQIRSRTEDRALFRNNGIVQIRLRMCDSKATEKQLLSLMYGYTIATSYSGRFWNPYGEPQAPNSELGETGSPIYPPDGVGTFSLASAPAPKRTTAPESMPVAKTPEDRPLIVDPPVDPKSSGSSEPAQENAPIVPLPPLTSVIQQSTGK